MNVTKIVAVLLLVIPVVGCLGDDAAKGDQHASIAEAAIAPKAEGPLPSELERWQAKAQEAASVIEGLQRENAALREVGARFREKYEGQVEYEATALDGTVTVRRESLFNWIGLPPPQNGTYYLVEAHVPLMVCHNLVADDASYCRFVEPVEEQQHQFTIMLPGGGAPLWFDLVAIRAEPPVPTTVRIWVKQV